MSVAVSYARETGVYTPAPDHIITVPTLGRAWLSANDRRHWRTKAELVDGWRTAAGWAAKQSKVPALGPSYVIAELLMIGQRTHRIDPANLAPTAKAAIDGCVDARLWPDDSAEWLTGPDMRLAFRRAPDKSSEALRLLIWGKPCCVDAPCHHRRAA